MPELENHHRHWLGRASDSVDCSLDTDSSSSWTCAVMRYQTARCLSRSRSGSKSDELAAKFTNLDGDFCHGLLPLFTLVLFYFVDYSHVALPVSIEPLHRPRRVAFFILFGYFPFSASRLWAGSSLFGAKFYHHYSRRLASN